MEEVYKLYSNISTNPEARALADDMYAHYVKLRKGAPAIDFEMTDAKGKKFRLSDFHGKAVYIDVWATWCGPCKALHPVLEELSKEYSGKVDIYQIDVDKEKELAAAFGIRSIPTLLMIPMKEEPRISQGALPKDQLKKAIDEFLLKQNNEAK